jgi:hypothetical protein
MELRGAVITGKTCADSAIMADRITVGPFFGAAARASALARGSPLCDHTISAVLDQIAVDSSLTKAPGYGEVTGRSPVDP